MSDRDNRIARVEAHLRARGADFELRRLDDNTATAALAAAALECQVAEIAKSIVFKIKSARDGGQEQTQTEAQKSTAPPHAQAKWRDQISAAAPSPPMAAVICVVCGDSRVDVGKVRGVLGRGVDKADAEFVKAVSGYEIGGVPPVAHGAGVVVLLDRRLRDYARIWAAAGSAYAVFGIRPDDLAAVAEVGFVDIAIS